MSELKNQEQLKHKAQIEKISSVGEVELADKTEQTEVLRTQLAGLEEELRKEEAEMRHEVTTLESEIQVSRDEEEQMAQVLA